jgi:glutathione synthase/RimK-type ligase-like ATP-grasp enzyme
VQGPVLLLTHSHDYYTIDLVIEALHARNASCLRIDTDSFPQDLQLSVEMNQAGIECHLSTPTQDIDLTTVPAIWTRRLWPGKTPANLDPRFAYHCYQEARTAFFDTLALLETIRWVNPIPAGLAAESKLRQLQLAREVGLCIPHTIVGNNPTRIQDFFTRLGGNMITKLLGPLSQTMDASGDFVYTSQVTVQDMAYIDELQYAPQIFQALIEKKRELRVILVGQHTFVGAIDASHTDQGRIDWRRLTTHDDVRWTEACLPVAVEQATRRLMQRLGLYYGAADFLVDADDRHIFLEMNPAGEWGWLQRDLGLPIAEAIADTLLSPSIHG